MIYFLFWTISIRLTLGQSLLIRFSNFIFLNVFILACNFRFLVNNFQMLVQAGFPLKCFLAVRAQNVLGLVLTVHLLNV